MVIYRVVDIPPESLHLPPGNKQGCVNKGSISGRGLQVMRIRTKEKRSEGAFRMRREEPNEQKKWEEAPFSFQIPHEFEAFEPPEARGHGRDDVRLMVSFRSGGRIIHDRFQSLPKYLLPGDVLVLNTSNTINAAIRALRSDGSQLEVHFSTHLPSGWTVELRLPSSSGSQQYFEGKAGEELHLPEGGKVTLLSPYIPGEDPDSLALPRRVRLWNAEVQTPLPVLDYLEKYGFPIRYPYVFQEWPLSYYQTVYATEPGSAEMPSAGRAFTQPILDSLKGKGVQILRIILHTGVSSSEKDEPLPEEYFRVPIETAAGVNQAHQEGKRVIAVGTTVIRALESGTGPDSMTHPGEGYTSLMITPQRGIASVDGLLTGLHEPQSTHLLMIGALVDRAHIERTYTEALKKHYLWHEFGDLHLILP